MISICFFIVDQNDSKLLFVVIVMSKESSVFYLIDLLEPSALVNQAKKGRRLLIETRFNSQFIPSVYMVDHYVQPSYQDI